jgi:hypothetical protein
MAVEQRLSRRETGKALERFPIDIPGCSIMPDRLAAGSLYMRDYAF